MKTFSFIAFLIYFQAIWDIGQLSKFKFKDCGASKDFPLILHDLSITPEAINLPGHLKVKFSLTITEDLSTNIRASISLSRKFMYTSLPIPCVADFGSCPVASVCKDLDWIQNSDYPISGLPKGLYKCPFKAGEYKNVILKFNLPDIHLNQGMSFLASGDYKIKVQLHDEDAKADIGCVEVETTINM